MRNIKSDAMRILAEVTMEEYDDVSQSYHEIKEIDDLLGILQAKSLINRSKGRRTNVEKRFDEVFRARLLAGAMVRNAK